MEVWCRVVTMTISIISFQLCGVRLRSGGNPRFYDQSRMYRFDVSQICAISTKKYNPKEN